MKEIIVVGAGPAGLVTAINLQKAGYAVSLWEKEKRIGGPPDWHPSVHGTPVNIEALCGYIGIDVSACFSKFDMDSRLAVMGDSPIEAAGFYETIGMGKHSQSYAVERGARPTSLDSVLYGLAVKAGVKVFFEKTLDKDSIKDLPAGSVIATGLGLEAYDALEIPFTNYSGYWSFLKIKPGEESQCGYIGAYTNEYGYSCYANGIWYILLFSRKEIPSEGLEKFATIVKRFENKHITTWRRFHGRTPKALQLFHGDFILTGTLAGFVEPAMGYGITGALVSGKIAADAVLDRTRGEAEFKRFTDGIPGYIARKKSPDYRPIVKMGDVWFDIA